MVSAACHKTPLLPYVSGVRLLYRAIYIDHPDSSVTVQTVPQKLNCDVSPYGLIRVI